MDRILFNFVEEHQLYRYVNPYLTFTVKAFHVELTRHLDAYRMPVQLNACGYIRIRKTLSAVRTFQYLALARWRIARTSVKYARCQFRYRAVDNIIVFYGFRCFC